jgi:hypothetical protein
MTKLIWKILITVLILLEFVLVAAIFILNVHGAVKDTKSSVITVVAEPVKLDDQDFYQPDYLGLAKYTVFVNNTAFKAGYGMQLTFGFE